MPYDRSKRKTKGENKERESQAEQMERSSSSELFVFTEKKGQTLWEYFLQYFFLKSVWEKITFNVAWMLSGSLY